MSTLLWREILRLATYTHTYFDTSLQPDTWDPVSEDFIKRYEANFRTKRALAFVSRQIHHLALECLCDILIIAPFEYDPTKGVICLQLGRVSPLTPHLSSTRHVLMDSLADEYFDDAAQSLDDILRRCHNLCGLFLSFMGRGWIGREQGNFSLQMQIARAVCPGLQFLHIRGQIWEDVYEALMDRVSLSLRAHLMVAETMPNIDGVGGNTTVQHSEEILFPRLNSFYWYTFVNTKLSFSAFKMSSLTYLVIGIPSPRDILRQILESAKDSLLNLCLGTLCVVDMEVLSIALRASRLQPLAYPIREGSVAWLNDEMRHDELREITVTYKMSLESPDQIVRNYFHPISKQRFPMLSTVTLLSDFGPNHRLGVYDLEDGKRLEDGETFGPMSLYLRGPHNEMLTDFNEAL